MACSHQKQTNTLKLFRLINELGTGALKGKFDAAYPPGALLQRKLSQKPVKDKLTLLLRKKVLNKAQWDKMYPSNGVANSEDFDISLLFILLRNVCGLLAANDPKWTSEPTAIANDKSPEANIARIRWFRNEVVHNRPRGIDLVTFEDYWRSITMAVVDLGIGTENVEELKLRPLDEEFYLKMLLERKTEEQNLEVVRRAVSQNEEQLSELLQSVKVLEEKVQRGPHEMNSSEPEALLKNLAKMDFTGEIKFNSSRYHPGTRQWVFEAFEQWYNNADSDSKVFLITGNPGMGKSVIAGVICKHLQKAKCLGGAFFCQYGNLRCRSARFLLQSIAHSLCEVLPEYKECLLENLSHNLGQTVERMSTEELFTELLQSPLNKISPPAQYLVVVIDGLDECEYESKNEILRLISLKFQRLPRWLKFVVTSRPEVNVVEKLEILEPVILQQEDAKNVEDIRLFVLSKLTQIICPNDLRQSVDAVTEQAQGLMLLAHFLVTYVEHTGKAGMSFDDIRRIYPRGISSVYEDYLCHLLNDLKGYPRKKVYAFLSTVVAARAPLPVAVLAKVLEEEERPNIQRKSLSKAIDSVSILLPVLNGHIHVFHKSFTDWLSTAEGHSPHDFSVDVKEGHRILGEICREAFANAKEKASGEETTALITYALHNGVHHLLQFADTKEKRLLALSCITDLELIHAKLLCPLCPLCSVLEEMLLALDVLASELDPESKSSINDCLYVLKRHASILSGDPSLVYQFLVNKAVTPRIVKNAKMCIEQKCQDVPWIEVCNKAAYEGPIRESNNCSSFITAADVAPNEDMAVFGCSNGAIILWSLRTAKQLWIRNSEKHSATCCLFAPDGSYIIFGFLNHVYTLSGECKELFPKITMEFEDCIFQAPENKKLLTRDCHGAMEIWDSVNGNRLHRLVHRFGAQSCNFSICGRCVISVSSQELYLWCSDTYRRMHRIQLVSSPLALVEPKLVCVSVSDGGTAVLLCQDHQVGYAFSIQDNKAKSLDLPKDFRILGTARDGTFILVDEEIQADDLSLPFSVMSVPHLAGFQATGLTAVDVNSTSCLAWEGSTFFLLDVSKDAEKPSTQEQVHRMAFAAQTNEANLLYSLSDKGITTTNLNGQQKEQSSFEDFGTFCVLRSSEWFIISQRNEMRKLSTCSSQDVARFRVSTERFIWDIRFLNGGLVLIIARLVADWFDTLLLVFDTAQWQVQTPSEGHTMKLFSIDVCSNGNRMITSDEAGTLVVLDSKSFMIYTKADTDHEEGLSVCKYAPDGRLIASLAMGSNRIHLWQSYPLQLIQTLEFPTPSPVLACGFASSSEYLLSLDQDRVLRIWATNSGKTVNMLEFDHRPRLMAICPQTNNIAVSFDGGKILLGTIHLPGPSHFESSL